ncbi:MAG: hypothetical protein KA764_20090, partial [Anaerolineales bacterium]|nr:hypothetical protein [Anaerolineales bacterium]
FKRRLPELAETAVQARTRLALTAAIERRLGVTLGGPEKASAPNRPADDAWDSVRRQLLDGAQKAFDARGERALADVERELKTNPGLDTPTPAQLIRALAGTGVGRAVAFDRQHRRMEVSVQRLHYLYLAAQMTDDWTPAELKEEILPHLRGAAATLRRLFGEVELRNRAAAGQPSSDSADTVGGQVFSEIYRQLMLQVIGGLWVDYLTSVEALRTSIGLEAYAQRDPLVAYKARATEMFQELLANIRSGVVSRAFNLRPRVMTPANPSAPSAAPAEAGAETARPAAAEGEPVEAEAGEGAAGGKRRRRRR